MGVVADFTSVSPGVWPAVLPAIRATGAEVTEEGPARGIWWFACSRGPARVGLAWCPEDRGSEVSVYCPARRFWRHPIGMWRLFRDVRRAVRSVARRGATNRQTET